MPAHILPKIFHPITLIGAASVLIYGCDPVPPPPVVPATETAGAFETRPADDLVLYTIDGQPIHQSLVEAVYVDALSSYRGGPQPSEDDTRDHILLASIMASEAQELELDLGRHDGGQ